MYFAFRFGLNLLESVVKSSPKLILKSCVQCSALVVEGGFLLQKNLVSSISSKISENLRLLRHGTGVIGQAGQHTQLFLPTQLMGMVTVPFVRAD